ncbi:hypothetical protein DUNSADRAFT_2132 [Dunaliella salina]|uniref:Encoded protein n=1 Tax=Dunaliella salina TaxID=3046 RepID=A0ABQ7FWL4_DUNSA|nr:hypothetical protein DUNSADRAFT_2132 [Dunaliella salina]|eukprot:KAF5826748.1 hypothetical protein DUNSADRAFT_2132 [Dunaliella salina]
MIGPTHLAARSHVWKSLQISSGGRRLQREGMHRSRQP